MAITQTQAETVFYVKTTEGTGFEGIDSLRIQGPNLVLVMEGYEDTLWPLAKVESIELIEFPARRKPS